MEWGLWNGNLLKKLKSIRELGLGMVKNIIENYKGTIEFTSKEEQGTIFTVKLPKDI